MRLLWDSSGKFHSSWVGEEGGWSVKEGQPGVLLLLGVKEQRPNPVHSVCSVNVNYYLQAVFPNLPSDKKNTWRALLHLKISRPLMEDSISVGLRRGGGCGICMLRECPRILSFSLSLENITLKQWFSGFGCFGPLGTPPLESWGGSEESAFLGERVNSDTRGEGKRLAHLPPSQNKCPLKETL